MREEKQKDNDTKGCDQIVFEKCVCPGGNKKGAMMEIVCLKQIVALFCFCVFWKN